MENNYIGKGGSPDLVDVVDVGRDAHSEGIGFIFCCVQGVSFIDNEA